MSKVLSFISLGDNATSGIKIVDDVQLVDMDEVYKDPSDSPENDALVEYVKTGKLSKAGAIAAKVDGAESLEPGTTKYNAKKSGVGFLSSLAAGFMAFIKKVIEYIQRGVTWVLSKVKIITGFAGRERELNKHNQMIQEINQVLTDLGINYQGGPNLVAVFEDTPYLTDKVALMQSIKPKMMEYKEYAVQLCLAVPEYNQLVRELNATTHGINHVKQVLDRNIKMLRHRVKQESLSVQDVDQYFHELTEAVFSKLNYEPVRRVILKIAGKLGDEKFSQVASELNVDFSKVVDALNNSLTVTKEKFSLEQVAANVDSLLQHKAVIRETSTSGVALNDDIRYVKFVLSQDDATFLKILAEDFGEQRILSGYQIVATAVSKFTSTVKAGVDLITLMKSEIDKMNVWINKVEFIVAFHSIENIKERILESGRADKLGVPLEAGKTSVKGMKNVKDSAFSENEKFARNVMEKHYPDLVKKINKVSQVFHMGVRIDV